MSEMLWPEILAICLLSFCTSAISGATGMGGGAIFFAGLNLPLSRAIPIHAVVQLVSNFHRVFLLRSFLRKEVYLPFVWGCLLSLAFSFWAREKITNEIIPYSIVIILLIYTLVRPKKMPAIILKQKGFFVLGFITGFLGILIGLIGPLIGPFFLRDDMTAPEIVANQSFLQFFVHACKLPVFFYLGFSYLDYALPISLFILFGLFGTWTGVKLLHKVKRDTFKKVFKTLLFLVTIRMSYTLYLLIGANS